MKPQRWSSVSAPGRQFTQCLLQVDPARRLTAQGALEHDWVVNRHNADKQEVDGLVVDALRQFGQAAKFRRCCLSMMAWSLSNEERAQVRKYFIAMDVDNRGTITLSELKRVLEDKFHVTDEETLRIFNALDSNNDEEIQYSDFLAAMVSTRIALHDDLLRAAFRKFDSDGSGFITVGDLRQVLGDSFAGEKVADLLAEADILQDGRISYPEFVAYLRGDPLSEHADAAAEVLDRRLAGGEPRELLFRRGIPLLHLRKGPSGKMLPHQEDPKRAAMRAPMCCVAS